MIVSHFTEGLPEAVGIAMGDFEQEFSYPLGDSTRFSISHGTDYLTFFRAMGNAHLLIAQGGAGICGSITRVERSINVVGPDGSEQRGSAHYLCDLKVRAASRGSRALARLFAETKRAIEASQSTACYCIVMEGTGRLPTDYTGRLGVPGFKRLGEIAILRLTTVLDDVRMPDTVGSSVFGCAFASIKQAGIRAESGQTGMRSSIEPNYLVSSDGDACGIIEDTRRGKRLLLESGAELLSAHLSGFKYRTPTAALELLGQATRQAGALGFPAVFVSIPMERFVEMQPMIRGLDHTIAPATIYGHGFESGHDWWIDTAEI